jgi:hypothetical protein
MSTLSSLQASAKKKEMEAFRTQLGRFKDKILSLERAIFELARQYCTLPLRLRSDPRIPEKDREMLASVFFEADEEAQDLFWGVQLGQAKFVTEAFEETVVWADKMAVECGFLKREHFLLEGREMFFPLDARAAGHSIAIASEALLEVEKKIMTLRYKMMAFGKEELQEFYSQGWEEQQVCFDGAMRFLHFWPRTEDLLRGAEVGKIDEEKRLGYLVGEFLGLEEMVNVREAQQEEKNKEMELDGGVNKESENEVKMEFEDGIKIEFEDGIKIEFEDGDSGVFFERTSFDSRGS